MAEPQRGELSAQQPFFFGKESAGPQGIVLRVGLRKYLVTCLQLAEPSRKMNGLVRTCPPTSCGSDPRQRIEVGAQAQHLRVVGRVFEQRQHLALAHGGLVAHEHGREAAGGFSQNRLGGVHGIHNQAAAHHCGVLHQPAQQQQRPQQQQKQARAQAHEPVRLRGDNVVELFGVRDNGSSHSN